METRKLSFGIEDVLVVIAILMIMTAMIVPHFVAAHNRAQTAKPAQAAAAPFTR